MMMLSLNREDTIMSMLNDEANHIYDYDLPPEFSLQPDADDTGIMLESMHIEDLSQRIKDGWRPKTVIDWFEVQQMNDELNDKDVLAQPSMTEDIKNGQYAVQRLFGYYPDSIYDAQHFTNAISDRIDYEAAIKHIDLSRKDSWSLASPEEIRFDDMVNYAAARGDRWTEADNEAYNEKVRDKLTSIDESYHDAYSAAECRDFTAGNYEDYSDKFMSEKDANAIMLDAEAEKEEVYSKYDLDLRNFYDMVYDTQDCLEGLGGNLDDKTVEQLKDAGYYDYVRNMEDEHYEDKENAVADRAENRDSYKPVDFNFDADYEAAQFLKQAKDDAESGRWKPSKSHTLYPQNNDDYDIDYNYGEDDTFEME